MTLRPVVFLIIVVGWFLAGVLAELLHGAYSTLTAAPALLVPALYSHHRLSTAFARVLLALSFVGVVAWVVAIGLGGPVALTSLAAAAGVCTLVSLSGEGTPSAPARLPSAGCLEVHEASDEAVVRLLYAADAPTATFLNGGERALRASSFLRYVRVRLGDSPELPQRVEAAVIQVGGRAVVAFSLWAALARLVTRLRGRERPPCTYWLLPATPPIELEIGDLPDGGEELPTCQ